MHTFTGLTAGTSFSLYVVAFANGKESSISTLNAFTSKFKSFNLKTKNSQCSQYLKYKKLDNKTCETRYNKLIPDQYSPIPD